MVSEVLSLPGVPESAGTARRFLAETLRRWGQDGFGDVGDLVVTELVANAALHARTDVTVRLTMVGDALRIEVSDRSPRLPVSRRHGLEAATGRGLLLVEQLSRGWGVTRADWVPGKTVWCELTPESATDSIPGEVDLDDFPDLEDLDLSPDGGQQAATPEASSAPEAAAEIRTAPKTVGRAA